MSVSARFTPIWAGLAVVSILAVPQEVPDLAFQTISQVRRGTPHTVARADITPVTHTATIQPIPKRTHLTTPLLSTCQIRNTSKLRWIHQVSTETCETYRDIFRITREATLFTWTFWVAKIVDQIVTGVALRAVGWGVACKAVARTWEAGGRSRKEPRETGENGLGESEGVAGYAVNQAWLACGVLLEGVAGGAVEAFWSVVALLAVWWADSTCGLGQVVAGGTLSALLGSSVAC